MDIIDVTLRDGGFCVDFDWDMQLAKDYYATMCALEIDLIELGYWKQTSKSNGRFYNLDLPTVREITGCKGLRNVSIMIDYHYCSRNFKDYPTCDDPDVSMVRMCARKNDIDNALCFGESLREYTGLDVSFNVFNAQNYTKDELRRVVDKVLGYSYDCVYFADTHGGMDLEYDLHKFSEVIDDLHYEARGVGFHLHNHSGLAMCNYRELEKRGITMTDTSIRGMGKGAGNLCLEHIIGKSQLPLLAQFIANYNDQLRVYPSAYDLITAKHGVTDRYAKRAESLGLTLIAFDKICENIAGLDKDNFNSEILG